MDLETIYRLYFWDVYRYVRALSQNEHLAEKIAQETFARALRAVDRFDGRGDVRAWLFTIAKNAWVDHCRRHRRETELPGEDLPGGGDLPDLLLGPPRGRRGGGGPDAGGGHRPGDLGDQTGDGGGLCPGRVPVCGPVPAGERGPAAGQNRAICGDR